MWFSFVCVCFQGCTDLVLKLEECEEEDICEGLNLDNAPLNFDVGDDIIGCSSQEHIESDHMVPNCLLMDNKNNNNTSVTASNFTDNALEVSFASFFFLVVVSNILRNISNEIGIFYFSDIVTRTTRLHKLSVRSVANEHHHWTSSSSSSVTSLVRTNPSEYVFYHLQHHRWKQCSGLSGLWYVSRVYNEWSAMGIKSWS